MALTITIDKAKCVGSGDCIETAPTVFQFDEQGKSDVLDSAGSSDSTIVAAARSCPVKAITVVDSGGNQLFPPPKK